MKSENFTIIPGFSKYEWDGTVCRNAKTKKPKAKKAKNGKYQLVSDEGRNLDRTPEELDALMPKKAPSNDKCEFDIAELKETKSTMFMVNLMHHFGYTKDEIMETLDITSKKVTDCRWHYDNRGYQEKIEKFIFTQSQEVETL